MNPATQTLPDVQEQADARDVALDEVGICRPQLSRASLRSGWRQPGHRGGASR